MAYCRGDRVEGKDRSTGCFLRADRKAIMEALASPNELHPRLYEDQQTRRILDRLVRLHDLAAPVGKGEKGLSEGRVQSVALRLICEREKEIQDFREGRILDY